MPNWKTHLEISKQLNKYLNYNKEEYDLFALGSILPDINNGYLVKDVSKIISHKITHFDTSNENNYTEFYNKYQNIMDNPLILGYFTHIYTDFNWNNNFYTKVECVPKNNENKTKLRKEKQSDFLVYNSKFIENTIDVADIDKMLEECKKIEEISIIKEDIMKAKQFLDNQQIYDSKLIHHTMQELEELKEKTIRDIKEKYIS